MVDNVKVNDLDKTGTAASRGRRRSPLLPYAGIGSVHL